MARKNKLTTPMQVAAVRSALGAGSSLAEIEKQYPELADGIAIVKEEENVSTPPPAPRGSGSMSVRSSMTRRPRL
jgi:hypothetical protein